VLDGASAGKAIPLTKPMTTIGRPDRQVAVILRRADGYLLAHVEGGMPQVNGRPIDAGGQRLADGDLIDLVGAQLRFSLH